MSALCNATKSEWEDSDREGLNLWHTWRVARVPMFISFKCTTIPPRSQKRSHSNIYLFIIENVIYAFFFYNRIISLSSGVVSLLVSTLIPERSHYRKKHIVQPVNDTCDCSHDNSVIVKSWEIKPSKCVNNCQWLEI